MLGFLHGVSWSGNLVDFVRSKGKVFAKVTHGDYFWGSCGGY